MTIVNINIKENTTWTPEGSPYIICYKDNGKTPTVEPGAVLTILDEVTVLLGHGNVPGTPYWVTKSFIIEGNIVANGAIFRGYMGTIWSNIQFKNNSSGSFTNCIMENGGAGSITYGMIQTVGTDNINISILGGYIINSKSHGIYFEVSSGNLSINGADFSDNTESGAAVWRETSSTVSAAFNNCVIENNRAEGLIIRGGQALVTNCIFTNNASYHLSTYEYWLQEKAPYSLILTGNTFYGSNIDRCPLILGSGTKINEGITDPQNTFIDYPEGFRCALLKNNIHKEAHAYWGKIGIDYGIPDIILVESEGNFRASLTIAAGQTIIFIPDVGRIDLHGDFTAVGTLDEPIIFAGHSLYSPNGKIVVEYAAVPAQHILCEHCIFYKMEYGMQIWNISDTGSETTSFVLKNCIFRNMRNDALWLWGAVYNKENALIEDCSFLDNINGIVVDGKTTKNSSKIIRAISAGNENCGIVLYNSDSHLENCTISDNSVGIYTEDSAPTIYNSIIYGNQTNYSSDSIGTMAADNIKSPDPLFADPANRDYHLKSQAGRWNPLINNWVLDDVTSPCIDAGDPSFPYFNEPQPNGGWINMGAYGDTIYASKSFIPLLADLSVIKTDSPNPVIVGNTLPRNIFKCVR